MDRTEALDILSSLDLPREKKNTLLSLNSGNRFKVSFIQHPKLYEVYDEGTIKYSGSISVSSETTFIFNQYTLTPEEDSKEMALEVIGTDSIKYIIPIRHISEIMEV